MQICTRSQELMWQFCAPFLFPTKNLFSKIISFSFFQQYYPHHCQQKATPQGLKGLWSTQLMQFDDCLRAYYNLQITKHNKVINFLQIFLCFLICFFLSTALCIHIARLLSAGYADTIQKLSSRYVGPCKFIYIQNFQCLLLVADPEY